MHAIDISALTNLFEGADSVESVLWRRVEENTMQERLEDRTQRLTSTDQSHQLTRDATITKTTLKCKKIDIFA